MAQLLGMETLSARLASFENTLPASKRRGSNIRGQKTRSWPHRNPSPEELADAGLHYTPVASSLDNTTCYLCECQIAGWEEEDDPVVEHLKLSNHCGWAIIKDVARVVEDISTMEDPTEERLFQARKATFASRWPHEHKRGWVCKTEKMAAAGWHFAPTDECEDFVSCAYCNLSLDGWEPKDSPFDEHYRRSPGCAFFHFAGTTAPKPGRGKKGRVSKASRLSTQSDTRIASQSQSIPELNESIDTSNLSHDTVLSEASTMASKKGGRGKGRTTRAKNAEPAKVVESTKEPSEEETQERAHDVRRGVKRKSEDISEDHRAARESTVVPECQPKRRATRSRNSEAPQLDYPVLGTVESASLQVAPGTRKRAPSRSRKISTASVNSTASQRGAIPDDMEIEAALEADLDKPMPDLPHVESESVEEPSKPKTRGRARKTNPSAAPSRNARQATADSETSQYQADLLGELRIGSREEVEEKAAAKAQGRKTRTTKKTTNKKTAPTARDSSESIATFATNADSQLNSSLLTVRSMVDDSGHETDASVASQKSVTRKGSKRKAGGKGKGKKGQAMSKNIEDILQAQPGSQAMPDFASVTDLVSIAEQDLAQLDRADDMAEAEAPKRPTRATKGKSKAATAKKAKTKFPQLSMPGMFSPLTGDDPSFNSILAPSSPPVVAVMKSGLGADQRIPVSLRVPSSPTVSETPVNNTPSHPVMISSPAQAQTATPPRNQRTNQTTPSPSPQSSDAENQPPSSRPPSARPPLAPLSPTKGNGAIQRIPIPAPGTPPRLVPLSPSKIGGGLQSALPWTAVDVEMIFVSSPEKENQNIALLTGGGGVQPGDLTSPEKAMTVEEWIRFRAGGAEERLKDEAERVVGAFEREGGRALRVLEGLEVWE